MSKLLYVESSPRGTGSISTKAAELLLGALPATVTVERLSLFEMGLPEFDGRAASAKYSVMFGRSLTDIEKAAWSQVTDLVEQFKSADHYLISAPMWNWGIPYKLKQYIDLITHPGMTFTAGPEGIKGIVGGSAVVVYARGGDYGPKDGQPDPFDLQSPYVRAWLKLVGIGPVEEVVVQQTMRGAEMVAQGLESAKPRLEQLAAVFG